MSEPDDSPFETIKLATRFRVPDYLPSVYAHHMIVQPVEDEIALTFFQLRPPFVAGSQQDIENQIAAIRERGYVNADGVARILVSKAKFLLFVKAMNDFMQNYQEAYEADEGEVSEDAGD